MKYLEKSFTLPAAPVVTQEAWDKIWDGYSAEKLRPAVMASPGVLSCLASNLKFANRRSQELAARKTPPATESKHPVVDTVALGVQCPNCRCRPDSYRHIETCVSPHEAD